MARIRTLKPTIWESEQVAELPAEVQILFIGLITQADDEGRQKGSPNLIRSKIFPYADHSIQKIREWLRRLVDSGLIYWYTVDGKEYIELPTWKDHQRVSHPTDSVLPSHSEADSAVAPESSGMAPEEPRREGKGKEEEGKGRESVAKPPDAPLSELLADLLAANDPNGKRPTIGKDWAIEEDRMYRLDGRKPEEAERLLRWTMRHHFWKNNIQSMPTFRKQYARLYGVATSEKSGGSPGMSQAERRANEIQRKREERQAA